MRKGARIRLNDPQEDGSVRAATGAKNAVIRLAKTRKLE